MKTIEEKAKAYDEALEKAKKLYVGANGSLITVTKAWLEKIFPELRESEDERIRKGLIEALTMSESIGELKFRFPEPTRQECIAYLERQKEHTEGDFARGYDSGYEACLNSHGAEWFEKQKEQKPIQTDAEKEYVRTLKSLVADFVRANNYIERGYYQQIYDWLDGRHVEQEEQKPAWSEEDEKLIRLIISILEAKHPKGFWRSNEMESGVYTEELVDFLKHLRPQPKPSWSEEDENVIETLIRELRLNAQFEFAVRKLGLDYVQTLTTLDKCRRFYPCPSWKPSEWQMKALERTIHIANFGLEVDGRKALESLHEELKKL